MFLFPSARYGLLAFLLMMGVARAEKASQIPKPLQNGGSWVYDGARVLDEATENRINNLLSPLRRKTGAEVALVTINSLEGVPVEEFAVDVARRWRVGSKGEDNGVLILVALTDRKSRIEVGYGLEPTLTDGKTGEIIAQNLRPAFKNGAYGAGLYATTLAVAQSIDPTLTAPTEAPASAPASPSTSQNQGSGRGVPEEFDSPTSNPTTAYPSRGGGAIFGILGLISLLFPLFFIGGIVWFFTAAMRRPLRCSKCRAPVQQLPDTAELPLLSPVQQFEQRIGARDYRVWRCEKCHNQDITAHDLPYSQFVQCPTCRHQTASTLVETTREPTPWQGGMERVILSCQWLDCKHASFYNRPTAPVPRGYNGSYNRGYSGGGDLLTGVILGSLLNGSGGGWGSGGGFSGGSSSGDSSGGNSGGFDAGPSDFGGGDFGGGGASGDW